MESGVSLIGLILRLLFEPRIDRGHDGVHLVVILCAVHLLVAQRPPVHGDHSMPPTATLAANIRTQTRCAQKWTVESPAVDEYSCQSAAMRPRTGGRGFNKTSGLVGLERTHLAVTARTRKQVALIPASRFVVRSSDRELWLDARKLLITATEVAKAATPSGFDAALAARLDHDAWSHSTEAMDFGLQYEPVLAAWLKRSYNLMPNEWLIRGDDERFGATPDCLSLDHATVGEIKTGSRKPSRPPRQHRDQMQWQMLCTGATRAIYAFMLTERVGGQLVAAWEEPSVWEVPRDPERIAQLIDVANMLHAQAASSGRPSPSRIRDEVVPDSLIPPAEPALPAQPTATALSSTVDPNREPQFSVIEIRAKLAGRLMQTEFEVIPFEAAVDNIALRVRVGRDPLLYYRNRFRGWGERYNDETLLTVQGVPLEDITLSRLSIHVAWDIAHEHFSVKRRNKDLSMHPNQATMEAVAYLRDAAESDDEADRELALACLAHLQSWSPAELKAPLGFKGASHETIEQVKAVIGHIRPWSLADSLVLRSEEDGSCLLLIEYQRQVRINYRLSAAGEWSNARTGPPLTTFEGVELPAASIPQVVTDIAVSVASAIRHAVAAPDERDNAALLTVAMNLAVGFLKDVHLGKVEGFESARFIATEYIDWLASPESEPIDLSDIDFSFFDFDDTDDASREV